MNYICQFLLEPIDLAKLVYATKNEEYKFILEEKTNLPHLYFEEFIKQNLNNFIYQDLHILYSSPYLYVCDDKNNYVKISNIPNWKIEDIFIYDIDFFNKSWLTFHKIFLELYIQHIIIDINNIKNANYFYQNGILPIQINDFCIYQNKKTNIICLQPNLKS